MDEKSKYELNKNKFVNKICNNRRIDHLSLPRLFIQSIKATMFLSFFALLCVRGRQTNNCLKTTACAGSSYPT